MLRVEGRLVKTEEDHPPPANPVADPGRKWAELGFPSQPGFSPAEFSKCPEHHILGVLQLPLCMLKHFSKNPP